MRVGLGYDVHRLIIDETLIIGGELIDYAYGLEGHSDADVLIHSIMDALIGAAGLGDIGQHFPDTDAKYKGISSLKLLANVRELLEFHGFRVSNIDCVIIAQAPKMAPYIDQMKINIANVLGIETCDINIKATTTEKLGFIGNNEGIACQSIAMII